MKVDPAELAAVHEASGRGMAEHFVLSGSTAAEIVTNSLTALDVDAVLRRRVVCITINAFLDRLAVLQRRAGLRGTT